VVMYVLLAGTYPFDDRDIPPPPLEGASTPFSIATASDEAAAAHAQAQHVQIAGGGPLGMRPGVYEPVAPAQFTFDGASKFRPQMPQHRQQQHAPAPSACAWAPSACSAIARQQTFHSFPQEQWAVVSDAAKGAINQMLIVDPRLRPTATDMLAHPWLREEAPQVAALSSLPDGTLNNSSPSGAPPREPSAASLSSSYIDDMRKLVRISKRARDLDAAIRRSRDGCSVAGEFMSGSYGSYGSATSLMSSPAGSFHHKPQKKPHHGHEAAVVGFRSSGCSTAHDATSRTSANRPQEAVDVSDLNAAGSASASSGVSAAPPAELPSVFVEDRAGVAALLGLKSAAADAQVSALLESSSPLGQREGGGGASTGKYFPKVYGFKVPALPPPK